MLALQCGSAHLVPKSHGWEGPITENEKVEVSLESGATDTQRLPRTGV